MSIKEVIPGLCIGDIRAA